MSDDRLVGFVDESCKPLRDRSTRKVDRTHHRHYAVVAAVTFAGDQDELRAALLGLSAEIGRPLHYSELSSEQRLSAMHLLSMVDGWEAHVFETAKPFGTTTTDHHVRAKLLAQLMSDLSLHEGVVRLVLEERGKPGTPFDRLNDKDRQVFQKLRRQGRVSKELSIEHAGKTEPLLSIADLIVGARTDALCAVSDEPYAVIAHRVRQVVVLQMA